MRPDDSSMSMVTVIVVAAGRSERFGGETPKLLVPVEGRPLLSWTLSRFQDCRAVDRVVLVGSAGVLGSPGTWEADCPKLFAIVEGGDTRQDSVRAGTDVLPEETTIVLVHDGARPFCSSELIERVIAAAETSGAAVPVLDIADTVKRLDRDERGFSVVRDTLPREQLGRAQTPQGFRVGVLRAAQQHAEGVGERATDDVALVERALRDGALGAGVSVVAVEGEEANVKVTTPADLPASRSASRVGLGHDVHPLETGLSFVLAGVDIQEGIVDAERFGPRGHSDGDALTHAVCDALLSAAGLGDIGTHFPDTADENAGRPSLEFLVEVVALLGREGWVTTNVAANLKLERPKLAPFTERIKQGLAAALGIDVSRVGLSAKRGEGMGEVGKGEAIVCDVVALIEPSR